MIRSVPLDIVGEAYPSRSKQLSKQTCINLYPEINDGVRTPAALYCWPGMTTFASSTQADRGFHVFNNELYQVAGTSLLKIASDGTVTTIGAIEGFERCVFADDGQNLVIVSPARLHVYNGTNILVGPVANQTKSVAMINNRAVYDRGGGVWATANVFDPLTIDSQNIAVAEAAGDDILRVFTFNQVLYLCGQKTIESWYNSGAGNPPFERIEGGIINKGIAGRYSICNDDELAYFLGDDRTVYALSGYQPRSIMTPAMAHEFESYSDVSDCVMWTTHLEGQDFVICDFPTANKTWGYSRTTSAWFQLSSGKDGGKWSATSYAYCYSKHLVARTDSAGASVNQLTVTSFQEVIVSSAGSARSEGAYFAIGTDDDTTRSNATAVIRSAVDQNDVARLVGVGTSSGVGYEVLFSPDKNNVALRDGTNIYIFSAGDWVKTTIYTGGGTPSYMHLAWSADGRYLALATGLSSVLVFDRDNAWASTTRNYITAANGGVYQIAWSPDGSQLAVADIYSRQASGFPTGNIVVFDTSDWSWQLVTKSTGSTDGIASYFTGVAFSPDGLTIAALCYRQVNGSTTVFFDSSTLTESSYIDRTGSNPGLSLFYNLAGNKIAFGHDNDASGEPVEIWDISGTPSKLTITGKPSGAVTAYNISWRSDDSQIAVSLAATGTDVVGLIDVSSLSYVSIPDVLDSGGYQLGVYYVNFQPGTAAVPATSVVADQIKERVTSPFNSSKVGLPLGKRLMMNRLELLMETGVGIESGQGSDPEIMIECSADGGQTFGPQHFIKIGKGGEYMKKVEWYNIQSGYEFVFRIRFSDPAFLCLHGAVIDVDTAGY